MYSCKVCSSAQLTPHCAIDFNQLYEKNGILGLPKGGEEVYYLRCFDCGFTFTDYMDDWSDARYRSDVYNSEYFLIDDEYEIARPAFNFRRFCNNFSMRIDQSLLDWGGGSGAFTKHLNNAGCKSAHMLDPFGAKNDEVNHAYDFLTSFEVMEHCTEPLKSFGEMFGYLKSDGIAVVSTLCVFDVCVSNRNELKKMVSYLQPRIGHISIYSLKSLDTIANAYGLVRHSLDIGYHIFYNPNHNDHRIFLREGAR